MHAISTSPTSPTPPPHTHSMQINSTLLPIPGAHLAFHFLRYFTCTKPSIQLLDLKLLSFVYSFHVNPFNSLCKSSIIKPLHYDYFIYTQAPVQLLDLNLLSFIYSFNVNPFNSLCKLSIINTPRYYYFTSAKVPIQLVQLERL